MNALVKIIKTDDGELIPVDERVWHLIYNLNGNQALCSNEYFGFGESNVEYELKQRMRGGITCQRCIDYIKLMKAIKL